MTSVSDAYALLNGREQNDLLRRQLLQSFQNRCLTFHFFCC